MPDPKLLSQLPVSGGTRERAEDFLNYAPLLYESICLAIESGLHPSLVQRWLQAYGFSSKDATGIVRLCHGEVSYIPPEKVYQPFLAPSNYLSRFLVRESHGSNLYVYRIYSRDFITESGKYDAYLCRQSHQIYLWEDTYGEIQMVTRHATLIALNSIPWRDVIRERDVRLAKYAVSSLSAS